MMSVTRGILEGEKKVKVELIESTKWLSGLGTEIGRGWLMVI